MAIGVIPFALRVLEKVGDQAPKTPIVNGQIVRALTLEKCTLARCASQAPQKERLQRGPCSRIPARLNRFQPLLANGFDSPEAGGARTTPPCR